MCSQPSHLIHTNALYLDIDLKTSTLLREQRGHSAGSTSTSIFSTVMDSTPR